MNHCFTYLYSVVEKSVLQSRIFFFIWENFRQRKCTCHLQPQKWHWLAYWMGLGSGAYFY